MAFVRRLPVCRRSSGSTSPPANLHVWSPDSPEAFRHRMFRAWLRVNPEDFERWWAEYQPVLAMWDALLVFEREWETVELIAHTG